LDGKSFLIIDLQEIRDFPLNEDGVLCAGIKNEPQWEYLIENQADYDEVVLIIERNFNLLLTRREQQIIALSRQIG
jgi:hypothetical protein